MTFAVVSQPVDNLHGDGGVDEVGGADLDGLGAGHEELQRVGRRGDATEADDGYLHRMGHLPYHADSHRLDRRAAEATGDGAEHGSATLHVDGHAEHRVDKADAVGAGALDGLGDVDDAGNVGRELHYQGFMVYLAHLRDHLGGHLGVGAETHAALLDVGAGDVELDGGDVLQLVDLFGHGAVLLDGGAADVDDDVGL